MKNRTRTVLAILAAALLAAACQAPSAPSSGGKASLTINVSNQINARTLAPGLDMNPASYTVTGTGPSGATFTATTSGGAVTKNNLAFGSWTVVVNATNSGGTLIGTGSATTQVNTASTSTVSVTVTPVSGVGTLNLGVSWPNGSIQTPSVDSTLTPALGSAQTLPFSISGSSASYSNNAVGNGYYTLALTVKDTGVLVAGAVDVVRIVTGQTTGGTYAFSQVNAPGGTIQVNIDANMQNPLDVSIAGASATQTVGTTKTLTASVANYSGNVVYVWYVNGVSAATGSTFDFNSGSVVGYSYRIDVTAFSADGTRGGSSTATSQAIPPPAIPTYSYQTILDGYSVPRFYWDVSIASNGTALISSNDTVLLTPNLGGTLSAIPQFKGKNTRGVAVSRNGNVMYTAVYQDGVYVSQNAGLSWNRTNASGTDWWKCATSADGRTTVAIELNAYPVLSTDFGQTWHNVGGYNVWTCVAVSDDGATIVLGTNSGSLYVSNDGGATWQSRAVANQQWRHIAMSADGSTILAAGRYSSESIYRSTDKGAAWSVVPGTAIGSWESLDISRDGTKAIALNTYGVYVSQNGGTSFTPAPAPELSQWYCAALSSDGQTIIAGIGTGGLYGSSDFGVTWGELDTPTGPREWRYAASDAAMKYIVATAYAADWEYVYRSETSGDTWTRVPGLPKGRYDAIAMSGDGSYAIVLSHEYPGDGLAYVSTDHGVTWTSLPSAGMHKWQYAAVDGSGATIVLANINESLMISRDRGASWTVSNSIVDMWSDLSISDDGHTIVASTANTKKVIVSTDGGVTWNSYSKNLYWGPAAVSPDGSVIVAGSMNSNTDPLYKSTDLGVTWSPISSLGVIRAGDLALSNDGSTILAGWYGVPHAGAYASVDGGTGWINLNAYTDLNYRAALVSRSGDKMILFSTTINKWTRQ